MQVLVCDDDSATRFVIHRLLVQKLGCTVVECGDGVEALQRLAVGDVELLILDITMPTLDGVDVLEAIRRSPQLAQLPVIMLSHERREEVIKKLIELGILGYVVKPPRAESLTALVERARQTIRARTPAVETVSTGEVRLDPETSAVLVDGNAGYRTFFAAQAETYGHVTLSESGLDGLAFFKRTPTRIVFIGEELGVVGPDLLARKLREMGGDRPPRIIRVRSVDGAAEPAPGGDDVMERSLVVATHRAELRRFVRITGPLDAAAPVIGDLSEAVTSASVQVFGMMLDSEILPATTEIRDSELCATVDITVQPALVVRVDVHLSVQDARVVAARMRSVQPDAVSDEDLTSAVSELAKLLTGRLQAGFEARQVVSTCSVPRVDRHDATPVQEPTEGHGLRIQLAAAAAGVTMTLVALVENAAQGAVVATAAA